MAAGGLLFLCSLLSPFYSFTVASDQAAIHSVCTINLWSFKSEYTAFCRTYDLHWVQFHFEKWFTTSWNQRPMSDIFYLPYAFPLLFFAQLATLATASASIVIPRRIYTFTPALLCFLTVCLMMLCLLPLASTNGIVRPPLQLGFWLTILSEPFLLTGFLTRRGPWHRLRGQSH